MKIGIGFDVHPLVEGENLIIGGVHIPYKYGLKGHSDADVLTHALMDALLGAMGKGDIGQLFPDTDEVYRDINSLLLLEKVYTFLRKGNYRINNIDLIIISEEPKISPYYLLIKKNYQRVLKLKEEYINIKATTTESMGFIGRGEGVAAQAIVLIKEEDF
ncbi:MAG TPA: 2-C-methyl-D-erythritol 2,4-cyclodiphosphate synthase [Halanaerobiales bacterium]|nr:2-C-methyl-D-erythritol 2,4-cyclodiphosphate synthase [Halanaerobiales bacterium]